ncbi:telomerase Cajal body protein 1-like, partial [Stegodyphus dumicola]|uniref:telomerase Cajal body protein 1-like n=1 Tax=Stegodyphus dumicola TaxID=202533 RepID=UPI0015AFB293
MDEENLNMLNNDVAECQSNLHSSDAYMDTINHSRTPVEHNLLDGKCLDGKDTLLPHEIIDVENESCEPKEGLLDSPCEFINSSVDNNSNKEIEILENIHQNLQNVSSDLSVCIESPHSNNDTKEHVHSSDMEQSVNSISSDEIYDFEHIPLQITGAWKEFQGKNQNNFTRGCKWAPDGSCILTCSDDNILRIFNLPPQIWEASQWEDITEMEAAVKIPEGEMIYDYCWYPFMNSADPSTCCLASTSKGSPVHLWDGFTGELRCSYRSYNHVDEIEPARSLGFTADGQKLFCGFEKYIRIFDVDNPGRQFEERKIFAKKSGQHGIISCFAFTSSNLSISAAGSYQKSIGIYAEPSGFLISLLEGQKGGVTQLQFSPDGLLLYSGGRKDPEILCWDVRNLGSVLYCMRRSCLTHQRMYFDLSKSGRYIVSGNYNGIISVWDSLKEPITGNADDFDVLEPIQFYLAHEDCVNGIG